MRVHVRRADRGPVANRLGGVHVGVVLGVVLTVNGLHGLFNSLGLDDAVVFELVDEVIVGRAGGHPRHREQLPRSL